MRTVLRRDLKKLVESLRKEKKTIVMTNGCFDILHVGHVRLLNNAKQLADILIVGINSDSSVRRLKGAERPLVSENDRAEIIANLKAVDYVTIFDEHTASDLLQIIQPDIYAKGGDYDLESLPEMPALKAYGGKVKFIDLAEGKSTTNLVNKIKSMN